MAAGDELNMVGWHLQVTRELSSFAFVVCVRMMARQCSVLNFCESFERATLTHSLTLCFYPCSLYIGCWYSLFISAPSPLYILVSFLFYTTRVCLWHNNNAKEENLCHSFTRIRSNPTDDPFSLC